MQVALFCDKGFEHVCAKHMSSFSPKIVDHCLFVQANTDDIIRFYYTSQFTTSILVSASQHKSCNPDEFDVGSIELPAWWSAEYSFKAEAIGFTDNTYVAQQIGGRLQDRVGSKVSLENPDIIFRICQLDSCVIMGIDLAKFPLYKREYRIYTTPAMLRSSFAFSCLLYAGYDQNKVLVDPLCGAGTLPIEAGLFATKTSQHKYRKQDFNFVRSGFISQEDLTKVFSDIDSDSVDEKLPIFGYDFLQKKIRSSTHNAKIASVLSQTNFARVDLDWLDTKFEEHSVDCIVTHPPSFTDVNWHATSKICHELFEQASHLLTADGSLVLVTNNKDAVEDIAQDTGMRVDDVLTVFMGQHEYFVVRLKQVD